MSSCSFLLFSAFLGLILASPIDVQNLPVDTVSLEIGADGQARVLQPSSEQRSATGDTEEFFYDGVQSRGGVDDNSPVQGFLVVKEGDTPMKVFPYGDSVDGRAKGEDGQPIPEDFSSLFEIFNDPNSPMGQMAAGFRFARASDNTETVTGADMSMEDSTEISDV